MRISFISAKKRTRILKKSKNNRNFASNYKHMLTAPSLSGDSSGSGNGEACP